MPACKRCGHTIQANNSVGICQTNPRCESAYVVALTRLRMGKGPSVIGHRADPPPAQLGHGRVKIVPRGDGDEYELDVYDGIDFSPVVVSRDLGVIEAAAGILRAAIRDAVLCDRSFSTKQRP